MATIFRQGIIKELQKESQLHYWELKKSLGSSFALGISTNHDVLILEKLYTCKWDAEAWETLQIVAAPKKFNQVIPFIVRWQSQDGL